jgi:hypothetical protein
MNTQIKFQIFVSLKGIHQKINMARVYLKIPKSDPILISNARAKLLLDDKEKFEEGKIENRWMAIDAFKGYLADIRSIILDDERSQTLQAPKIEILTDDELAHQRQLMNKVRKNVFGK